MSKNSFMQRTLQSGPTTYRRTEQILRDEYSHKYNQGDYRFSDGRYFHDHYLSWKELSKNEKSRYLGGSIAKFALAIGLLGGAQWAIGSTGEPASKVEMNHQAQHEGEKYYLGKTAIDKFKISYLEPEVINIRTVSPGGSGLLGYMNATNSDYVFGQDCLATTAYSTDASTIRGFSNGDISAVASLSAIPNGVMVHPAGSNAPALTFSFDGGELVPDGPTQETLSANGCNPDGLVMSTFDSSNQKSTYVRSIHPRNL